LRLVVVEVAEVEVAEVVAAEASLVVGPPPAVRFAVTRHRAASAVAIVVAFLIIAAACRTIAVSAVVKHRTIVVNAVATCRTIAVNAVAK
jgi:hypothetical protein